MTDEPKPTLTLGDAIAGKSAVVPVRGWRLPADPAQDAVEAARRADPANFDALPPAIRLAHALYMSGRQAERKEAE